MNRKLLMTSIFVVFAVMLVPIFADEDRGGDIGELLGDDDYTIPSWIKAIAGWWATGQSTDSEFRNAMEFLIQEGAIPIESVNITETTLSDETERLYQLEIAQKEDRITILEDEVEDTGLDNATLLQSNVEKDQTISELTTSLENKTTELQTYKDEYPLKVGKIGGKMVNVDTIRELESRIVELEAEVKELKD